MPLDFTLPEGSGVMLCGHGSRNRLAVDEFANLSRILAERLSGIPVEYGYLEFADPVINIGLDKLRDKGVTRVFALPGMLFAAGHAKNDIPSVLNTYAAKHGVDIAYGRELGVDLKMLNAAGARVGEAEASAQKDISRHDTLLMVVGRGASDPDANSNVAKMMRMLWEGMGYGWGETAYSGVTFPLVAPALDRAARLGFKRIIVFPYFLFTGVLVKRIYAAADAAAEEYPDIDIVKAPYLNDHPLVVDTFIDRLRGNDARRKPDELFLVQVSRGGARLRGRGRRGAGKPSPSRRGHWRRAGELSVPGRLRRIVPRRGLLPDPRPALHAATCSRA